MGTLTTGTGRTRLGLVTVLVGLLALVTLLSWLLVNDFNSARAGSKLYIYSAKITCVPHLGPASPALMPGKYRTAVNVHNPWDQPANIEKRVILSNPQGIPPITGDRIQEVLPAEWAFDVDCVHMRDQFGLPQGASVPGGKGFMVIESDRELDVVAVYTSRTKTPANDGVGSSTHVEYIQPRIVDMPPPPQPPSSGDHNRSKRFGDGANQVGLGVATDSSSAVVATGYFEGTVDFGGGPLTSLGGDDIFLAKLDLNGNHLWSKRFGHVSDQRPGSGDAPVASDPLGNILLTGQFKGTADFGGVPVSSSGGSDIFLAKFDPNGNHLWSKRFGDGANQSGTATATGASGDVLVTGFFDGTIDLGGGPLTSAGAADIFLAKFDANGNHLWSKRFGGTGNGYGNSTAIDPSGSVFVTGQFVGTVDFGGGPLVNPGSFDIFLAKFDSNGTHLWSKRFGDFDWQEARGVVVDPSGNIRITGNLFGSVDFGSGPLTSAGSFDIFLVKFDTNGNHLWSSRFGDALPQSSASVAADSSGKIVLTGKFDGGVDFGGGPLISAGGLNIFLAKLDSNGNHLWSKRFGDGVGTHVGASTAVDPSGNVALTGKFAGTVDFGGGPLTSSGGFDVFLAKFAP